MSAENELHVFRMANGELWIAVRRCGDTAVECWGEVCAVVAKVATMEAARVTLDRLTDPASEDYVSTEYGGTMPSADELERKPASFLKSNIGVSFRGRSCTCLDPRDLSTSLWVVEEADETTREWRDICYGLTFAEAVTIAHLYANGQPGECRVSLPTYFRDLGAAEEHQCPWDDEGMLPGVRHWLLPR